MNEFKELLAHCLLHGLERRNLCKIVYDLNNKTMVGTMHVREFLCKITNEAWDFLEALSDKTYKWGQLRRALVLVLKSIANT